jgi:hypothetical protein
VDLRYRAYGRLRICRPSTIWKWRRLLEQSVSQLPLLPKLPVYLLRDRDAIYGADFHARLTTWAFVGEEQLRTRPADVGLAIDTGPGSYLPGPRQSAYVSTTNT